MQRMNRDEAKEAIKREIPCTEFLKKSKGGSREYECPYCGSGTKDRKTGGMTYYPKENKVYCFACGKSKDSIDLYMKETGKDYNEALKDLAERLNIEIKKGAKDEEQRIEDGWSYHKSMKTAQEAPQSAPHDMSEETPTQSNAGPQSGEEGATLPDVTEYVTKCMKNITDPAAVAYFQGRGISMETVKRFRIGYDAAADPAGKGHPCPRIIIQMSKNHYVGRRIDGIKDYKAMNNTGGKPSLFNGNALKGSAEIIFICEGAFDALSIIEMGYEAIALNSASNAGKFVEYVEKHQTEKTFAICPDNDTAGQKALREILEGMRRLNVPCVEVDFQSEGKDANDALMENREKFAEVLRNVVDNAVKKPDNVSYYIDAMMGTDIGKQKQIVKTGFAEFDRQFGGLYPGLYVLPALSSLGKTTFASQMADQIAENGSDVLFFSMEMSRLQMVSKGITRRIAKADPKSGITSLQLVSGNMSAEQWKKASTAINEYKTAVGSRLSVIEGDFKCTISFIGEYIREYVRKNDTRPVVFIDYLQVLKPGEYNGKQQQKKDVMDDAVEDLKLLTRQLAVPIVVISSINRANYLKPLDFESLKESGNIEYTADVVFGLQFQVIHDDTFNSEAKIKQKREMLEQAKAENPRRIELTCLKNRYGRIDIRCNYNYYPAFDLYAEEAENPFEKRMEAGWKQHKETKKKTARI